LLIGISEVAEYKLLRRFVNENGKIEYVRIQPDEIKIGEKVYVEGNDNKIKRLNENTYMFMRFDSIDTVKHTDGVKCDKTLADLYKEVHSKLDYDLEYAEDRVELVNEILHKNYWVYDYISTHRSIRKEVKTKNSFRSEQQPFDRALERLASYLYFPKFLNKEDELEYEKLKKKESEYSKKSDKNYDELEYIIDYLRNHHIYTLKKNLRNARKEDLIEDASKLENSKKALITEEQKQREKVVKRKLKRDMENYEWDKMYADEVRNKIPFYSKEIVPAKEFRKQLDEQFRNEIKELQKFLGLDIKDKKQKERYVAKLIIKLDEEFQEKGFDIDGWSYYEKLCDIYRELCADYGKAQKILVDEIEFKRLDKTSTVYNFNRDTWYENENGEIVEVSRNTINFGQKETYRGLLLNYTDLKNKYYEKTDTDMWAILKDFEEILRKTELTFEEKIVVNLLFDNMSQKDIRKILQNKNIKLSKNKISRLINEQIPSKLLNTYLNMMDEYIYTYWFKGNYKKCSKCGEIKLISNDRYFGKDIRNVDGFQSICKKCDNYRKKWE
jgi:hypothetical protein